MHSESADQNRRVLICLLLEARKRADSVFLVYLVDMAIEELLETTDEGVFYSTPLEKAALTK